MKRSHCAYIIIGFFLLVSLLYLKGNKYDTAERFWMALLFAVSMAGIVFSLLQLKTRRLKPDALLLSVFVLFLWLSFFFSETKNFGFSEALVLTACIATYLLIARQKVSQNPNIFLKFIVGLAVLSSVFGLIYFVTQFEPRVAGLFFDPWKRPHFFPNTFALFLLMTWPLAFFFFQEKWKKLYAVLLGILFAALFLTYSRGAWFVFGIQMIATLLRFLLRKNEMRLRTLLTGVATTVVTTVVLIVALIALRSLQFPTVDVSERIAFQNETRQTSIEERFEFFKGAMQLALEKPLLGHGPFSFRYVYPQIQPTLLAISDHPHNWFLKIAAENGLPAFIALASFFLYLFFISFKKCKHLEPSRQQFVFFTGLSMWGGLAHNMIDYNLNFLTTTILFWVLLGLYRQALSENSPDAENTGMPIAPLLMVVLVLILSLYEVAQIRARDYGKSFFPRNYFLEKEVDLNHHLSLNPYDARAWYSAGNYQKAFEYDPKNQFRYYVAELERLRREGDDSKFQKIQQTVTPLLTLYESMLEQNLHFTAFTDNPENAAALYELLGMPDKASEIRRIEKEVQAKTIGQNKLSWDVPFGLERFYRTR